MSAHLIGFLCQNIPYTMMILRSTVLTDNISYTTWRGKILEHTSALHIIHFETTPVLTFYTLRVSLHNLVWLFLHSAFNGKNTCVKSNENTVNSEGLIALSLNKNPAHQNLQFIIWRSQNRWCLFEIAWSWKPNSYPYFLCDSTDNAMVIPTQT